MVINIYLRNDFYHDQCHIIRDLRFTGVHGDRIKHRIENNARRLIALLVKNLLAIGHVFIIHFFIGHLRKLNFPMDRAMFEGSADLTHSRHERPAWIQRLEKGGELDSMLVAEAAPGRQVVFYLFGFLALAAGIYLVVGALLNVRLITWQTERPSQSGLILDTQESGCAHVVVTHHAHVFVFQVVAVVEKQAVVIFEAHLIR